MFVGRKKELEQLGKSLSNGGAILLYGKRRVGKTALIKKALENVTVPYIYYECTKEPLQANINAFVREAVGLGLLPAYAEYPDFQEVMRAITHGNDKLVVVFDEYQYLKEKEDSQKIDSIFQKAVDTFSSNVSFVFSGSHIKMMKDLRREGNALYGRFGLTMELKELNYLECQEFYPSYSIYEKVVMYSIFGGSPLVNSQLSDGISVKDNILATILNADSMTYTYASQILLTDVSWKINADGILASIGNGRKHYREIENLTHMDRNGNLNKTLQVLQDLSLVNRRYPINKMDDNKKVLYEISDNLMRFYYTYVYPNRSAFALLPADAFYARFVEESLFKTFVPLRFESIAKDYLRLQVQRGKIDDVEAIGTFYYDDKKEKRNGEFDCALKHFDGDYSLYEVKCFQCPMNSSDLALEERQAELIKELRIRSVGFISLSGFTEECQKDSLHIEGKDLYSPS